MYAQVLEYSNSRTIEIGNGQENHTSAFGHVGPTEEIR